MEHWELCCVTSFTMINIVTLAANTVQFYNVSDTHTHTRTRTSTFMPQQLYKTYKLGPVIFLA